MSKSDKLYILTGLSGSGKSTALNALEDLGYFCIDNLPAALVSNFADFIIDLTQQQEKQSLFALLLDCRHNLSFAETKLALDRIAESGIEVSIIFFDCNDEVVARRYKQTRRPHPLLLADDSLSSIDEALKLERKLLADFKTSASFICDTSNCSPHDLRSIIEKHVGGETSFKISIASFGFKRAHPSDADLIVDVRFLPNPYFVSELRDSSGLDSRVKEHVFSNGDADAFLEHYLSLLDFLLPRYIEEGKSYLKIAVGCTAGMHRSVAVSEELRSKLAERGYQVSITHRDL